MHWKDYDWSQEEKTEEKPDYRWMLELDYRQKQWREKRKEYVQMLKNSENPDDSYFVDELYGWRYEK